jgi:tRNA (guanine-N7-)-methyltransferase
MPVLCYLATPRKDDDAPMTDSPESLRQRSIRSFVMRMGRMTDAQRRALDELWPRWGVDLPTPGTDGLAWLDLDGIFGRQAPRSLEIGFGDGESLAHLAGANPQRDYLGIEVHRPGVGHLLLLAEKQGLGNVRAICHDAVDVLQQHIAPAMLDEVLILFSDPWHKKRHHKRRLIQTPFVDLLASRLRPDGLLKLATDWEPYAQQMLEVLNASPWFTNLSPDGGYVPRPHWRTLTRFERRGERLGHGVWDLAFQRNGR